MAVTPTNPTLSKRLRDIERRLADLEVGPRGLTRRIDDIAADLAALRAQVEGTP